MILKVITLFFSLFLLSFSKETSLLDIKTMNFVVKEEVRTNNEVKTKVYNVKYLLPNDLKKEIIYPEMNKGEIYIYSSGKKITYLPFFDEITEEKGDIEADYIANTVNKIREREKKDSDFKEKYNKGQISQMEIDKNIKAVFKKFQRINGYMIPIEIEIYETGQLIAKVYLSNVSLNKEIKAEEFKVKK